MTQKYFLITAFGKDRPGMVAGITEVVCSLKGNLADASMTRLGGEFAMMLICDFPKKLPAARIASAFRPLEKKLKFQVIARPIAPALARTTQGSAAQFLISVYGTDRAGLVYEVAAALAKRKLSITDLNTKVLRHAAKPVYVLLLEVTAPPSLDVDELREELDRLRQSLGVEITFQDIDPVAL
jgi:glycine cleavage system transcriptional repressor